MNAFSLLLVSLGLWTSTTQDTGERAVVVLTDEARALHAECLVFDGHNDLPWQYRTKVNLDLSALDISKPLPALHTDIPRLRSGGLGAQFWSAYGPADSETPVTDHLEQIDLIKRLVARYPETFQWATSSADIERARREGKIASLIGIEGGHAIDNSIGVLRMYHELGVRYMTLTHSDTLDWADAATDEAKSGGLSEFGEKVVRTMNELGMLVDISHVSVETMKHALRVTRAPVIASHSSAYGVAVHPRNIPDDVLKLIKANGGVVMVNFFSGFVVPESAKIMGDMFDVRRELKEKYPDESEFNRAFMAWRQKNPYPAGTVHDVVDHIDHIVRVAGVEHVGLGSDYDGVNKLPVQLEDVSTYPFITQELLNRGYAREDVKKIMGGNTLRALREAERVASDK